MGKPRLGTTLKLLPNEGHANPMLTTKIEKLPPNECIGCPYSAVGLKISPIEGPDNRKSVVASIELPPFEEINTRLNIWVIMSQAHKTSYVGAAISTFELIGVHNILESIVPGHRCDKYPLPISNAFFGTANSIICSCKVLCFIMSSCTLERFFFMYFSMVIIFLKCFDSKLNRIVQLVVLPLLGKVTPLALVLLNCKLQELKCFKKMMTMEKYMTENISKVHDYIMNLNMKNKEAYVCESVGDSDRVVIASMAWNNWFNNIMNPNEFKGGDSSTNVRSYMCYTHYNPYVEPGTSSVAHCTILAVSSIDGNLSVVA
ncbi:hypothetical protein V6N13_073830 [Hibiscus sabdariffa]